MTKVTDTVATFTSQLQQSGMVYLDGDNGMPFAAESYTVTWWAWRGTWTLGNVSISGHALVDSVVTEDVRGLTLTNRDDLPSAFLRIVDVGPLEAAQVAEWEFS